MATFLGDGKQKNSIPVLDGVRAIACLSIITFHMNLLARFYGIWNPALEPFLATYWDLVYPICYAIGYGLCMFALLHGAAWLKRPFEWTPLRWLGLISYTLSPNCTNCGRVSTCYNTRQDEATEQCRLDKTPSFTPKESN